ncbi:hypothetical protein AU210_011564 [Fusarium oxysporum f. sp. radicis-cucumerinum]|uniref:Zinc finger PHD-type domain-containing protein n=2 Tax=Fusarium oxysporum TaxID=5507 RepID=W9HVZ6_FUSOX|nr:hypothetical protein FOYG_12284 [Fusarium oxysporum NRRL 32931]PCD29022.1 hypothetical protein AU210_011564 [Fusarium oxysporum f. sp. radicis-cucumerinum]
MTQKKTFTRTVPFTQRNWEAAHNAKNMGATLSTPKSQDDSGPPQKRQKVSVSKSNGDTSLIDTEDRTALRVEIHKIFHKDSKKVRPLNALPPDDIIKTKAKCQITVSDVSGGFTHILYRSSQSCDIVSHTNPSGPHRIAYIKPPKPFLVPKESILVNRQDDPSHDFSNAYRLDVEMFSVQDGNWPPLEAHELGVPASQQGPVQAIAKQNWILHSEFPQVFGRIKKPVKLTAGFHPQRHERLTNYIMDVELKWASGTRRIDKTAKNCITAFDSDGEIYTNGVLEPISDDLLDSASPPELEDDIDDTSSTHLTNDVHEINGTNGVNGFHDDDDEMGGVNGINGVTHEVEDMNGVQETNEVNGHVGDEDSSHDISHDLEEELEGDHTPNRALRKRNNKQYNLKVLTAQAHGKERKTRDKAGQPEQGEGFVTYMLSANAPVHLLSWQCCACGNANESLDILRAHLMTYHPNYVYTLEKTSQGPLFRITHVSGSAVSPSKELQLGKPTKPLDQQAYVNGDDSWVTSRYGPDHMEDVVRFSPKHSTERQLFGKSGENPPQPPAAVQAVIPRPEKKKVIIPKSCQPLFDPVSKARLKPGEELPKPVVDNAWLLQKHREDIGEFSDVSKEEKEYIRRWDAFILQENVTSGQYFRRAWVKFVKENASWLVGANYRMNEYGKHLCVLMARDVLDNASVEKAGKLIDEARARLKSDEDAKTNGTNAADVTLKQSPRASQITRGANGCTVCQLPVLGPSLLICSNKKCSNRLYHASCIENSASIPVTRPKWLCNGCSKTEGTS